MGGRARSVRRPWCPKRANIGRPGRRGSANIGKPGGKRECQYWHLGRPKCQYWQGVTLRSECLARLTIAHSLGDNWPGRKFFRPTAGGNSTKARMGCPSTPHKKQTAEGRLHTAVGGSGGRSPPGGCGVDGRGPIRAIIRLPPAVSLVANRIRWSPDPDRVNTGSGGHRRGAHRHVANVSTTVNKCKHM